MVIWKVLDPMNELRGEEISNPEGYSHIVFLNATTLQCHLLKLHDDTRSIWNVDAQTPNVRNSKTQSTRIDPIVGSTN